MFSEIKYQARQQMIGKLWRMVIILLLASAISGLAGAVGSIIPAIGSIASMLLVSAPITMGTVMMYLAITYGEEPELDILFAGFRNNYMKNAALFGMYTLYVFLWSLLFVIPGIIKAISYSQAFYILAENPDLSPSECLELSKAMMNGNKWEYFCLGLSFIGWGLLVGITFGLASIYVVPYMSLTFTNYYHRIKGDVSWV